MQEFIFGIIFMSVFMPVLDNIMLIVAQFSKYICTILAVKTYLLEKSIPDDECECQTHAIGFEIPSISCDDEDEEEDDE